MIVIVMPITVFIKHSNKKESIRLALSSPVRSIDSALGGNTRAGTV